MQDRSNDLSASALRFRLLPEFCTVPRRTQSARQHSDKKIDKAVEMTFPASDPVTAGKATGTEAASRPTDRHAPLITKEDVDRASAGLEKHEARAPADDAAERGERKQRKIDKLDQPKTKGKKQSGPA